MNTPRPLRCVAAIALVAIPQVGFASDPLWTGNGLPVCTASGDQKNPRILPDGAGGAFLAWEDARNGTSDVYVLRLDPLGGPSPGWPAGGLPVCEAAGPQSQIQLATDGAGGCLVVWRDDRSGSGDIYVQRLTADGAIAAGWADGGVAVCTAVNTQDRAAIAADGSHGAVIAWADRRSGNYDIYVQRVSGAGAVLWHADGLWLCGETGHQGGASVVSPGDGSAYVTWRDPRAFNPRVYIARVLADGNLAPGWPVNGVWCSSASIASSNPRAIESGNGDALILFDTFRGGGSAGLATDVEASQVREDGFVATENSPVVSENYIQELVAAAPDAMGGAVLVWQDQRNEDPVTDVYASRIDDDGGRQAGWPSGGVPVCVAPGMQSGAVVTGDGVGGLIAAWQDQRAGGWDLYARRVLPTGGVDPAWPVNGLALSNAPGDQTVPVIARVGSDECVVVWEDSRNGNADIYAARFSVNGVVPAVLALHRADATFEAVTLEWVGAEQPGAEATLERHVGAAGWAAVATLHADGSRRFAYVDHDVFPGARVGYRLRMAGAVEPVTGDVWVDVPARPAAARLAAAPNPTTTGRFVASFTLGGTEPARLELLDLAGRIVAHTDVGGLGAGTHDVEIGSATLLRPGIYRLRLTAGPGAVHESRIAVLR